MRPARSSARRILARRARRCRPGRQRRRILRTRSTTCSTIRTSGRSSREQLIQKLVASNPSPAYVQRVSAVFDNDGTGRRGNLPPSCARFCSTTRRGRHRAARRRQGPRAILRLTQLWRAYDAKAASGKYVDLDPTTSFGQGPLTAPSVFNFFSPFYAPPGAIADQGLVAPELQIATEYQNTLIANFFYAQAFHRNSRSNVSDPDTSSSISSRTCRTRLRPPRWSRALRTSCWPARVSDALRTQTERQVARVGASNAPQRVAEAVWLVTTSPEYAVQR